MTKLSNIFINRLNWVNITNGITDFDGKTIEIQNMTAHELFIEQAATIPLAMTGFKIKLGEWIHHF